MINFVIIQYGARIVSSCFEKESDTIKFFFPWNDFFQFKIKFLIMLPWSIYVEMYMYFMGYSEWPGMFYSDLWSFYIKTNVRSLDVVCR